MKAFGPLRAAVAVLAVQPVWGSAAQAAEVVVISPHSADIRVETARAFSDWHRARFGEPAAVRWRDTGGGTSQIVRFLRSEYRQRPGGIGIDVMYGGGVDPFLELKDSRLLVRRDPPMEVMAGIPAELGGHPLYDPGREWFGSALSGFGIVSNLRVCRILDLPEVRVWSDLADPQLFGWVGAADPRQSGSALAIFEIILQAYGFDAGWRIIAGICANTRAFLQTAALPPKEAALGEVACAMSIDIFGWSKVAQLGPENMAFVLPEGLTAIQPDAIAVLRGPPNPGMASRFVEFVLGRPGQLLWMLPQGSPGGARRYDINRMSVLPELYDELHGTTPVRVNPFRQRHDFAYDPQVGARRRRILAGLLGAVFIDIHPLVRRAREAMLRSPRREAIEEEFTRPIVGEAELFRLADGDWNDAAKRQGLVNRWQRAAADQWRRIAREAERED